MSAIDRAKAGDKNLRWADLRWADLRGANLREANLHGARGVLSVIGLPSGHAILVPLTTGWRLTVGCWSGTTADLRELIARDDDWPDAKGDQIAERRPMLAALADMCDAWTAAHGHYLAAVRDKWGGDRGE